MLKITSSYNFFWALEAKTTQFSSLTHLSPMLQFYNLRKRQKTKGFPLFPGGIEMKHWT